MDRSTSLFSKTCSIRLYIFLSGLSIFIGGVIYILLRPSDHVFFGWMRVAGLDKWISPARSLFLPFSQHFPDWFIFSLPNMLWAFAYALLITSIWSDSRSWLKYFWLASVPVMVLGFEFMQYPGIIPGTFCIQDMVFGLLGLFLGLFIGTIKTKNHNYHEKAFE